MQTYYKECTDDYARVPNSGEIIIGLIQTSDVIDGWFLFDNSAENASQEYLLKNQSVYDQIAHIYGDYGNKNDYIFFLFFSIRRKCDIWFTCKI